jgi:tetratricopeptide (TPR) repeat protein
MIEYVTSHPLRDDALPFARPPRALGTFAIMLALALVVYLPAALRAQFLGFDDNLFFGPDNPEFREGLGAVLDPHRTIANAYLPVAHLVMWLEWWFGGGRPLLPHLVSLLLHTLVAAVFVRLLLRVRVHSLLAHLAGALFVVHPALAESVAWTSGAKDLLCGLFVLLALLQTASYAARPGGLQLPCIAALGVLAMYSKATAVVQPFLALLVCLAVPGAKSRLLAPFVLLLVTVPIAMHHQWLAAAEGTLVDGAVGERLTQVPGAYLHYLGTAVWPVHLNVLYPEVQTLEAFRAQFGFGCGIVGACVALAFGAWWVPMLRGVAFGLGMFLLALLPFNTAYPASSIAAADRYLYLAIPGLAVAVVVLANALLRRVGVAAAALSVLPLLWLGGSRAQVFENDESLWQASLATDRDNAVAHLNLVTSRMGRAVDVDDLREHLHAAVKAAHYPIHELRARVLLREIALQLADYDDAALQARAAISAAEAQLAREPGEKRRAEAASLVLQARLAAFEPLRLAHDTAGAAANLAIVKKMFPDHPDVVAFEALQALSVVADELAVAAANGHSQGLADDDPRGQEVDRKLAAALAKFPEHAQLLVAQASWDRARGRVWQAIKSYRKAQQADPQCIDAWLGAARMLRERESYQDALACAVTGLQHRPDPALRQEEALALVGLGRMDDAIVRLEAYVKVHPKDGDTPKVLSNLLIGRAYARLSEPGTNHADILKIVERALAYYPGEPRAHLVLGRIAREQRHFAEAVRELELAHKLMPDFEDARQQLAEALSQLGFDYLLAKQDEPAADAWLRCLAVAPKDMDTEGVRMQLRRIWRQHEESGIEHKKQGDVQGAIADFRRCLQIDPEQHWAAWLLATALHDQPDADRKEVEALCRTALAGQQKNGLDRSMQVYLLAKTLAQEGIHAEARALVEGYLKQPDEDAKPQVLEALRAMVAK